MHVRSTYCPARVTARLSVHTALSKLSQTVCKRVAWFVWQGWFGRNGLVLLVFTRLLLANQAKPSKRARVNELKVMSGLYHTI